LRECTATVLRLQILRDELHVMLWHNRKNFTTN